MAPALVDDLEKKTQQAPGVDIPDIPVLCAQGAGVCVFLDRDGELSRPLKGEVGRLLEKNPPPLVCHAPWTAARLGLGGLESFDILELFAFVHPGKFCVPTPTGVARALGIPDPEGAEDVPLSLLSSMQALLGDLVKIPADQKPPLLAIAGVMGLNGRGWKWTPFVFSALGASYDPAAAVNARAALEVWKSLPEWAERAPPPPPGHHPVTAEESRTRLAEILHKGGGVLRPRQIDYATQIVEAFAPTEQEGAPRVVLAEAGTGIGKTLGYLAPAMVWAEKNGGAVWLSTYTRNLQRQLESELRRFYDDPDLFDLKVAIRKGRENYLCLLNFAEMAAGAGMARMPAQAIAAGIMARWIGATRAGEFTSADFPAWLPGLFGRGYTTALSDRRGECIHAACEHYHRCFVERSIRKSRHASLVVANHALVMIQAALAGPDFELPRRYVFDEGHHVFEAADGVFATHLSGLETRDLRLWLVGPEGGRKGRARGLRKRIGDLTGAHAGAEKALEDILHAGRVLPAEGWGRRLLGGAPSGSCETFLFRVLEQVSAREQGRRDSGYSLETPVRPATEALEKSAQALARDLLALHKPMRALIAVLGTMLAEGAQTYSEETKKRFSGAIQGLEIRASTVRRWIQALDSVTAPEQTAEMVDWLAVEREGGQTLDIGLFRHFIDPTGAFAKAILPDVQGVAFTSATLRDGGGDGSKVGRRAGGESGAGDVDAEGWARARARTGADFLAPESLRFSIASPFDYVARTMVFVATDVDREDSGQVAAAFRALFSATGGGGLGLFTAISRLRAVQERISADLEARGIPLYAQHVDGMDTGTLVDMFRADLHACLLGTDALRDGVDVPGDSLRLVVFDRVPWPRPTILHKARREAFGGADYDDSITRLRLRQAFGRLVRRDEDRGVFVMLDSRFPSRLANAFPEGVAPRRLPLAEILREIKAAGFGEIPLHSGA